MTLGSLPAVSRGMAVVPIWCHGIGHSAPIIITDGDNPHERYRYQHDDDYDITIANTMITSIVTIIIIIIIIIIIRSSSSINIIIWRSGHWACLCALGVETKGTFVLQL